MDDFHIERLIYVPFANFQIYDQTHHHRPSTPIA